MTRLSFGLIVAAAMANSSVGFAPSLRTRPLTFLDATTSTASFIDSELRGAAMKLHTRKQAPKEGEAKEKEMETYTPTRSDYLQFLVDSQYVFQALEDVVNEKQELKVFRNTGLERTKGLDQDIEFFSSEYGLDRPDVGAPGKEYGDMLRNLASVPEFMCHYYNFYFAHTAGGRMIGKKMSSLLLEKKTLEFYKWEGNLEQIKTDVKANIEKMAAEWSADEKGECVGATPDAFRGGGGVNSHLSGGRSPH